MTERKLTSKAFALVKILKLAGFDLGERPRTSVMNISAASRDRLVIRVANLWPEFPARDVYSTAADGTECKNPMKSLVAATFEKAKTYVFAGFVIMNPTL